MIDWDKDARACEDARAHWLVDCIGETKASQSWQSQYRNIFCKHTNFFFSFHIKNNAKTNIPKKHSYEVPLLLEPLIHEVRKSSVGMEINLKADLGCVTYLVSDGEGRSDWLDIITAERELQLSLWLCKEHELLMRSMTKDNVD